MDCPASIAAFIINNTKKPVFWKDTDRRYVGVNRAFLDFFGFSGESAVVGKTGEEACLFSDSGKCRESDLRALNGERLFNEIHVCVAQGRETHISVTKSPLLEHGRITGIFGMFEDVTAVEFQRREIERLNSELKLRIADYDILMESTRVSIVKIRLDEELTVDWCNEAMLRGIGYTREEYGKLFSFSIRRYFHSMTSEVEKMETAVNRALEDGDARFELFMKVPAKSGFIWINGVGTFTDYKDGEPSSLYVVYTDVTEVVATQEKLREAELQAERARLLAAENERLKELIDNVPSGISVFRSKPGAWGEMSSNRYLTDKFGLPAKLSGLRERGELMSYVHADDYERCRADLDRLFNEGKALESVYRFRSPADGRSIWAIMRGSLVREANGELTAYFSYTNIDAMKKTEAELRENRLIYEDAVKTCRLSVWTYDIARQRITMLRSRYAEPERSKLGIADVIENVTEHLPELYEGENLAKVQALYQKVAAGENASCEAWIKPKPGREQRCERVSYTVVRDEEGRPVTAHGMSQDVTAEKKLAERYEREAEALRNSRENGMIAKCHDNLTQNIVIEETSMNEKAYGTPAGISYDESCRLLVEQACVTAEDRRRLAETIDRRSLISRYQRGETKTRLRYRRKSADGSLNWALIVMNTYMMPFTGDLECFSYTYDVTEKVLGDEVMRLVSNVAFDYIGIIYAQSGSFEFLKKSPAIKFPEVRQKAGYEECCSYVRSNFVKDEEAEQFADATSLSNILRGLAAGGRHTSTYRRTEEGRLFCKQLDYVWLDKETQNILVMRSDVTAAFERDQKQLRDIETAKLEADRANEAKSSFLSSMSHDLRTPLNGVLGFTGLALREQDPLKKQGYLHKIDSSGKLLLDLVNDTLELSRIESGKMTLEPQAVDGREFWESVATALRPSAELKGVKLETDTCRCPNMVIWIDRLKVQKVVLNLLSNAVKYTPAGGSVHFSVSELEPPVNGCTRRIVVADTGIGMSREFLARLYEPFSQERRPEAANVVGTGLGLSIVKRIVDLMGGSIRVESELNKGTCFTVDLPIPCREAARAAQKQADEPQASLAGKRVLLCEDNYLNREIAELLLKDQGIEVDCAADGKEGLEKFAASAAGFYDAILMDIRMPVMDGCKATAAIRGLNRADAAAIPIVAMTADAFEEDFHRTKEAGMNGHITKPIDPERLFKTLRENIKMC